MQLKRLATEYGDTKLGPQIQLRLALVMCRAGEYEEAEKTLEAVRGDARLSDIERAQVNLTRGYVAQERATQAGQKGDLAMEKTLLDEARKRYEAVKDDPLYGAEAKHMLEVLDRVAAAPVAVGTPATPK
jgi:predicted negative regulator of RcsB-dependent stress response